MKNSIIKMFGYSVMFTLFIVGIVSMTKHISDNNNSLIQELGERARYVEKEFSEGYNSDYWAGEIIYIKVGDTLLRNRDWDNENPFIEEEIDTIVIIRIIKDYAQWRKLGGEFLFSGRTRYLLHSVKHIK